MPSIRNPKTKLPPSSSATKNGKLVHDARKEEDFQSPSPIPYTTFTPHQKHLITLVVGLATITSPLTATIYFPLLPLLQTHFHASSQSINLTITLYIIFQALSPFLFAPLSDSLGRRPIYLLTLTIYVVANLGLALNQHSYTSLLVLRALQSLGASAAYAVSYGVVADVCVPSERGKMLGPVSAALNLGTCVGPVVGGLVALRSGSYGWVFWSLVIIGAVLVTGVGGFLPETARNVVSNGSVRGKGLFKRTWWSVLWEWKNRKGNAIGESGEGCGQSNREESATTDKRRIKIKSPLASLRIIFWKDTFPILWMHGSFYLVDYSIQTIIPSAYKDIYHFNELEIGLSYLPRGVGIILGGIVNGKMMDRNYRITAKEIGHTVDRVSGDDLNHFPIEKARTRDVWCLLGVFNCALIGYGWALQKHAHVSIPLIIQFICGVLGTCFYNIFNTLLVDLFPESPSTAAAAASITRCTLAAAGVAALQPLLDALGRGWYFTVLALVSSGAGSAAICVIQLRGMNWRSQRLARTRKALGDGESGETALSDQVHIPRQGYDKELHQSLEKDPS